MEKLIHTSKIIFICLFTFLASSFLTLIIYLFVVTFKNVNSQKNQTAETTNSYRNNISNLVDNENFTEAEKIIKKRIALERSDNCENRLDLINVYLEKASTSQEKKIEPAQKIITELQEEGKCLSDRWYGFAGYAQEIQNKLNIADEYYTQGLSLYPESIELLIKKGHLLWLMGKDVESIELFLNAEKKLTDSTESTIKGLLFLNLGRYYGSHGRDIEKAENYFKQATTLINAKKTKSEAYYNLSTLLLHYKKDTQQSFQYGLKAIQTDNNNDLGFLACARAKIVEISLSTEEADHKKEFSQEELQKINDYLEMAIFINPQRTLNYYWQGKLIFVLGDIAESIVKYDKSLEIVTNDQSLGQIEKDLLRSEIYFAKAISYYSTGNKEEAKNNFDKAFQFNPQKTLFMMKEMKIENEFPN